MNQSKIFEELKNAIQTTLQRSGETVPELDPETKPTEDLPDFDSHNIAEALVDLEIRLECPEIDLLPLFEDNPHQNAPTLGQLASGIKTQIDEKVTSNE